MNEELYQEQGISFSDILFLVKKNIIIILIITVLCTIVGGVYAFGFKKPVYTAEATAVVQAEMSSNGNEATSYSYSVAITNTFSKIIKSIAVINTAADNLIEDDIYTEQERDSLKEKLQKNVSVTSESSTLIITVSAQSVYPEEAILLANAILDATISVVDQVKVDSETGEPILDENGKEQYNYFILANKLKELAPASEETTFQKGGKLVVIVVSFLIGLIISFAIVLIKFLSDDTYTSKDAFEKTFNINILSSIQNAEGGN